MALFQFSRWDGRQGAERSAAVAFDRLADSLLENGDYLLRQLERMDRDGDDVLRQLIEQGYLERGADGRIKIALRGLRRIETQALEDLFAMEHRAGAGKHPTSLDGLGAARHEQSKPYTFGDPIANLDLHATFRNAIGRQGLKRAGRRPDRAKIELARADLVVYETEHEASCATVVLLDMSGSMARYGKFYHAKKVALALRGLVRSRFPEDTLQVIGFYTYAGVLGERALLHAAPKPVNAFDERIFLRVPLADLPASVPEHFTNIHAGLYLARQFLTKQSAGNKQIICITDGEPTAHLEGRELVLMYPPGDRTARATLAEVAACRRAGIAISTFALIEDYFYLGLTNFVDEVARTARGIAIYCNAGEVGKAVLDSFVRGRRSRKRLG